MMDGLRTTAWVGPGWRIRVLHWGAVPVLGAVLGGYLWEFLSYNQDFVGPQLLSSWQTALLVAALGPAALTSIWLLSGKIGARLLGVSWRQGLMIDAPSYWPVALLAFLPASALFTGHGPSAYQALVVIPVSVVFAAGVGLKTWRWARAAQGRLVRVSPRAYTVALGGSVTAFLVVVGTLALLGYESYSSWYLDMGLVDQALWNTLHGRFLQYTFYGGVQMSLLADHVEPILLALVPLYAVWPDPRALLAVRVLAVGLTALPLYGMALRELESRFAALCIALAYLVFPMVVEAGIRCGGNIRTETLALPFLAAALYSLKRESWRGMFLWLLPALACKEHISLLVAALGVYLLLGRRHWRPGLGLLALGLTWFVVAVWVFLPWVRGGEMSRHFAMSLSAVGGDQGVAGIVETVLAQPAVLWETMFTRPKVLFLFLMLLGLGFLALLGGLSAVVLPIYVLFLLYPKQPSLNDYHYVVGLPFLLGGAAAAVRRLGGRGLGRVPPLGRAGLPALAVTMLACSLAASFFWGTGPLSWSFWRADRPYHYWRTHYVLGAHARHADRVVAQVPPEVPVIASDYLLIRLSQRPAIYHFFFPPPDAVLDRVDYAVVDLFENHIRGPRSRAQERELQRELLAGGGFALTRAEDGVLLFARGSGAGLYNRAEVVPEAAPQHVLDVALGERLRLLGYDFAGGTLVAGRRYRVTYYWEVLPGYGEPFQLQHAAQPESLEELTTSYALIDTLAGPSDDFRVFHLPTYVLLRPEEWQPGQVIRETYEFALPDTLPEGAYEWTVGLYAEPIWFGIRTDADRLVPGTERVVLGEVELRRHE
jgi:uncharacterized membrane protein